MMIFDMSEKPINTRDFDPGKCNACGLCVTVCAHGGFVLAMQGVEMLIDADCEICKQCELVCPTGAISFPFEIVEEP
jgi:ferredoxin